MVIMQIMSSSALGHRDAPAERRVERAPEPVAARRIAHAAHGFFGLLAAADHRKIDAERADIHRRLRQPRLVGGDPRQRHAGCARGRCDPGGLFCRSRVARLCLRKATQFTFRKMSLKASSG
jgi:hypothetical protein